MFRASGYCFLGLLGLAVLAFWPSYVSVLPSGGIERTVHLHAAVMTLWLALLIAQPFLVRAGRRALHRALGKVSYGVAALVVVTGVLLTHAELVREGAADFAAAGTMSYLPLVSIAWFAACYGLAIAYRRTPALHARFMLGASLALIDPIAERIAVFYFPPLDHPARYPLISWAVAAAALVVLIIASRPLPRGRLVFPVMLGAITAVYGLWFTLAPSAAWLGFARWFRDLPLT